MTAKEHRHNLHVLAEDGFCEFETKKYIMDALKPLGCELYEVGATGIIAYFDFGKSTVSAFRAEMDALPTGRKTGIDFVSESTGFAHMCGHDGHMAMLLGFAGRISSESPTCNAMCIFQPAEEKRGGAESIVFSEEYERHRPERMFAIHLMPKLEKGRLFSRAGAICAGSSEVKATFFGDAVHITEPRRADAIGKAAEFYLAVMAGTEKDNVFLRFGMMSGGTAGNITPEKVEFSGTARYFSSRARRKCEALLSSAKNYGGDYVFTDYAPPVVNDKTLFRLSGCEKLPSPVLCADDFSVYGKRGAKTLYMFLGAGNVPLLHSPDFDFDETVLSVGTEKFIALCKNEKISSTI